MEYPREYYAGLEAKIPAGRFRTRFAPSPTGYMHLGSLRTAMYAYLCAKKAGGDFILRIEDTDQERFVEGASQLIYDTLALVGLSYDEGPNVGGPAGPYIQSERKEIYQAYAKLLVARGHAYYCFCDKRELDGQRAVHEAGRIPHKYDGRCSRLPREEVAARLEAGTPYVIRQKVPAEGVTFFDDLVYGRIEVENTTLDDQVLLKGDGLPTYNFANVVDDRLMGITHIIRGNEFLSSTPKHRLLYQAFGWQSPAYIHLPQVMRDATHKLSKRDGDAYFSDFLEKGYCKEALMNYIALLGWSPGGEQEKFSLAELAEAFDIKGISKSSAIFDFQKLNWLNGQYLRDISAGEFHGAALPYIKTAVKRDVDTGYLAGLLQARCELLSEIPGQIDFIDGLPDYSPELYTNKKMKTDPENAREALLEILPVLQGIGDWQQETIHGALLALVERLQLKNGRVLFPLRVALSGKAFTPGGGVEICVVLGKDETLQRIQKAIKMLGGGEGTRNETRRSLADAAEIKRIAAIAKLDVKDNAEALSHAIRPVMDMLDKLADMALPADNFSMDMELVNTFREDTAAPKTREEALAEREKLLSMAPETEANCISVPKLMGEGR